MFFVEFALAVIGIIVISFLAVRLADWLDEAFRQLTGGFDSTRQAAGNAYPGGADYGGATQVNLIGDEPEWVAGAPNTQATAVVPDVDLGCGEGLMQAGRGSRLEAWDALDGAEPLQESIEQQAADYEVYKRYANVIWADKVKAKELEDDRDDNCVRCKRDGPFCDDQPPLECPGECTAWGRTCTDFGHALCCCVPGYDGECRPTNCPDHRKEVDCACWDDKQERINNICDAWDTWVGPGGETFHVQEPYGPACGSNSPPECSTRLAVLASEVNVYAATTYETPLINDITTAYSTAEDVEGFIGAAEGVERDAIEGCP